MKTLLAVLSLTIVASCIVVIGGHDDWDSDHHRVRGSGNVVTETRESAAYDRVELDSAADVRVTIGDESRIVVRADDNVVPHVVTRVRNGVLIIENEDGYSIEGSDVEIELVTPHLAAFEIDGAGNVYIVGLAEPSFRATIDGAGDLHASGSVEQLEAVINGAGTLALENLEARQASVEIDGSGSIRVHAHESLRYEIDGSGNITYAGSPAVRGDIDGSGVVRRKR